jgi:electron transport complex protein RnfD
MRDKLVVSTSAHIHTRELTPLIMWSVFFALLPAGIAGTVIFGPSALKIIIVSILACLAIEFALQKFTRKKISVLDGSAAITGLLLAYNLPSTVPIWIPVVGAVFAVGIAKFAFGGLGRNIFNPVLAARAFLLASWPGHMTSFARPFSGADTVTQATPLMMFNEGKAQVLSQLNLSYLDLFLGKRGGCIGEVCILALLLGAVFLIWKKYIPWQTPLAFISSVGLLSWAFGSEKFWQGDLLFGILSGGLILGAFFMATDYVTSPLTVKGQIVFGIGCGMITFFIRKFGGYPEGVSYSILIMNAFTPLIDRHIRPRVYGRR